MERIPWNLSDIELNKIIANQINHRKFTIEHYVDCNIILTYCKPGTLKCICNTLKNYYK